MRKLALVAPRAIAIGKVHAELGRFVREFARGAARAFAALELKTK